MIDSNFDFPGWSTAVDPRTGRQYYINLLEKTTHWDDPRLKFKQVYGSAIPMQDLSRTLHGSPKSNVQVYPTQNYPAQAFQSYPGQSINASPIPSTKNSHHSQSHTVEMSSLSRSSPHTPRIGNLIKNHQQMLQQQREAETSFSSPTPMETEATVSKINTMFPTASEHHIRLLLKKYHNREAVVISALQVEKHPLTTPGPYTPPVQRSFHTTAMALSAFGTPPSSSFGRKSVHLLHGDHLTITSSSNGSPIPMRPQSSSSFYTTATTTLYGSPRFGEQYRSSPKPHSSPKMKLRYLKSMFPKAEETIILDVLAMVDNNVQKASEQLKTMGFEKKEMTPAPRLSHRKKEEHQPKKEIQPTPPPKPKTADEKKKLKARLQMQYSSIPEKIISMALESVDHSEEKALRILDIVLQEDKDSKKKEKKKGDAVEKNVSFREPNSKNIDLDKAAAIENDETMIINSDHSIITTPIESPQDIAGTSKKTSPERKMSLLQVESDDTPTSDTSSSDAAASEKIKRHRPKARSESNRSEKSAPVVAKKDDSTDGKVSSKTVVFKDITDENFLSIFTKSNVTGPNVNLAKGPKDELLLTDYVTWNGANPDILKGHRVKSVGANSSLRIDRNYTPRGRSSELCKGPIVGLAKGSMYSQMTRPNVACN